MKKITGFFLALLPIFIIVLMFMSGMIVKGLTHVFVSSVEFAQDNISLQWTIADEEAQIHPQQQLTTRVLPFNSSNPEVEYISSNPDIVEIDQNGKITATGFGIADVYAVSKENELINAKCTVEVWDRQIHHIAITNEVEVNYLGFGQRKLINAIPVPSSHLEEDPTLHFKIAKDEDDVIDRVDEVGEIIANNIGQEGEATIEISTSNSEKPIVKQLDVRVGVGVSTIDLSSGASSTTIKDTYSLYDDILVYPEKKENISASDFTYDIDHKDVAEISDVGVVAFHQPGTVTVKATYKRNSQLSVTKTITSTCNYLSDVAFNRYNYDADISDFAENPYISQEDINWHIYPKTEDQTNITISSTNPEVVSVEKDNELLVHSIGSTTLLATINVGEGITKQDACNIFIYDKSKSIIVKNLNVTVSDSLIYNLRDNIDLSSLKTENQHIKWEITSSDAEIIDNETIFFKNQQTSPITVKGYVYDYGGTTPTRECQFNITCSYSPEPNIMTVPSGDNPVINVQAGKKYKIKAPDGTTPLWPDFRAAGVKENFYATGYEDEEWWFIPKAGKSISLLNLYEYGWIEEWFPSYTVKLIVEQPATGIYADDHFPFYTTSFTEMAMSTYIPTYPNTATDAEGKKILPSYEYEYNEGEVFVDTDENIVQFKKPSVVSIKASFDNTVNEYFVKSTFGGIGKFNLKDGSGNVIESGDEINISPDTNEPTTLMVNSESLFANDIVYDSALGDQFKISSLSDSCNVDVVVDQVNKLVRIEIEPKEKSYSEDTIMIETGMFTFYLDVNISTGIFDFNLFYQDQLITLENNTSYISDLMVNVQPLPLTSSLGEDLFTIKLNDQPVKILPGSRALLQLHDGENTVEVSSKNSSYVETYTIVKANPGEITNFSIMEADDENNIYMDCGKTIAPLTININGFADDTILDKIDWKISYTPVANETCKRSFDKIYIQNIALATNSNPGFENSVSIGIGEQESKTFKIHRDIFSRIELPNHDNFELTDQKGLQKVHVYGNTSFYTPEEGEIDYYKLPIDIYDYKGNLITNKADKQKALATLNPSLIIPEGTTHSWEYDSGNDFIKIKFDQNPEHLYTEQEMYDNAFENHTKDVTFKIATPSGKASASYTFVPVKGRNVYCQEAMADCIEDGTKQYKNIVLQTNFGLEGTDKDNVPFDQVVWYSFDTIYGNGYTINFNADAEVDKEEANNDILIAHMFNTTFQGCNDKNVKHGADIDIQTQKNINNDQLFAYNIFKNIPRGLFLYCTPVNRVKNCLFYNNYLVSINVNADNVNKASLYIEDCVMFNCSSAAITQVFKGDVYFKGFMDVYNFKNSDALVIGDMHFEFMWDLPIVHDQFEEAHAIQMGADGREYVNSCMISVSPGEVGFWDEATQQYIKAERGVPGAAEHLKPIATVDIEFIQEGWKANIWGNATPEHESGCPSYYDEFDARGNLRWDFLNSQIRKVMRITNWQWFCQNLIKNNLV